MSTCQMAVVTELMARSLTTEELANRLLDHPDVAVRQLARYCIDGDTSTREAIEEAQSDRDDIEGERDEANRIANEAESLLDKCAEILPDGSALHKEVIQWLASR